MKNLRSCWSKVRIVKMCIPVCFHEETELFITTNIKAAKNIVQQKKPTLLYLMSRDIIV